MDQVGVIGPGDMGGGLAANLMRGGFRTLGHDIAPRRMESFRAAGGVACDSPAEVGRGAPVVFVMVMTGAQAASVILGPEGLAAAMPRGGTVILTATIRPPRRARSGRRWKARACASSTARRRAGFRARRRAR